MVATGIIVMIEYDKCTGNLPAEQRAAVQTQLAERGSLIAALSKDIKPANCQEAINAFRMLITELGKMNERVR
jgi:hypothetical protein